MQQTKQTTMDKIKITPEQIRFLKDYGTPTKLDNGTEVITIEGSFIIESAEYGLVNWLHMVKEEDIDDNTEEEDLPYM